MAENHDHQHDEDTEGEDTEGYGMAFGFRIFEQDGELFLAEVEVTPYVDEPEALGATLVFHPLDALDPTEVAGETDWPAYPLDIDDDLRRSTADAVRAQFREILRQLAGLSEDELRRYLKMAMEEAEAG